MEIMNRFLLFLRSGFAEISGWLVFFITVFITSDVVLRYIFNASIPAGMEFTQVLLVLMVFFAFGQAQASKVHIRVDFLLEKLPGKVRYVWEVLVYILALAFFTFIFLESIPYFLESYAMGEYYGSAVRVPIYPARGAIAVGCGLMIVELIRDIVFLFREKGRAAFMPSLERREIDEAIAKSELEK